MNILIVANGTLFVGHQELSVAAGLKANGHTVKVLHNPARGVYCNNWIPSPLVIEDIIPIEAGDFSNVANLPIKEKIDVVIGVDQSVVGYTVSLKKFYKSLGFCLFLDFPVHVVEQGQPNYDANYSRRYYYYLSTGEALDSLIFISSVAADYYRTRTGRNCELSLFTVCSLGIIEETLNNVKPSEEVYVSSSHRWEEYKGGQYLIQALYGLDVGYKAIAVGGSKEDEQVQMAKSLLGSKFKYFPKASEELKHSVVAGSALFCYPQCNPWMGAIAPLEAMALGIPTVVFDYPVNREEYEDCAVYAKPKNVDSLQEKIVQVLNWDIDVEGLVKRARERVYTHFTPEAMGKRLTVIFEKYK